METIGLRELNQHPSRAIARVRAGISLIVTDRGRPVLRMIPEQDTHGALQRLVDAGLARPPVELGMPDVAVELLPDHVSLSDLVIAERNRDRST